MERQAKRKRDHEASRPFYQFVFQLSLERERIQEETGKGTVPLPAAAPANINTTAYERVRNAWVKHKIWNSNWGTLPGMSWKHEDPLVADATDTADGLAPSNASHPENGGHEAREASVQNINGLPTRSSFECTMVGNTENDFFAEPASVGRNHLKSSVANAPLYGIPEGNDFSRSENYRPNFSSSEPDCNPFTAKQLALLKKAELYYKNKQTQLLKVHHWIPYIHQRS